jgi:signal transduction histidine kinase
MTLRTKIVFLVVGLTAAVIIGLGLFLSGSWSGWSRDVLEHELADRVQELADHVEPKKHDGGLELEDARKLLARDSRPFRIVGPEGTVASNGELNWPDPANGTAFVKDDLGRSWRVISRTFEMRKHEHRRGGAARIVVQAAGLEAGTVALEARFRRGLLLAVVAALVAGGIAAALLAHASLAPLRRLAGEVNAIEATSLDRRVGTTGLDPELARVAASFNELLARLEGAMRLQRSFVARASHALRTPTATILARAEVTLRQERTGATYREALAEIATAARESAALVDHLLLLARLDETRSPKLEDVPLDALAAELVQLLRARSEQAAVGMTFDVPSGLSVRAERTSFRELLEALLDNALRYTARGGRAGLQASRTANAAVQLTVWDTGPGIPAAERAHAFERFRRGSAAEATSAAGSGLGLAIVKAIADAHGATVDLRGRDGGGLEVVVTFDGSLAGKPRAGPEGATAELADAVVEK